MSHGMVMRQTPQAFHFEASSAADFEAQLRASGLSFADGAVGRLQINAERVLGLCPVPLGFLATAPIVGDWIASTLTPAGITVTERGGINGPAGLDCDFWMNYEVPAGAGQGAALMAAVPVFLLGVFAAGILVGLAISLIFTDFITVLQGLPFPFQVLIIAGGIAIAFVGLMAMRRGRWRKED